MTLTLGSCCWALAVDAFSTHTRHTTRARRAAPPGIELVGWVALSWRSFSHWRPTSPPLLSLFGLFIESHTPHRICAL